MVPHKTKRGMEALGRLKVCAQTDVLFVLDIYMCGGGRCLRGSPHRTTSRRGWLYQVP